MERSDEELIERHKAGDGEAVKTLFIRYQQPMFNFALRLMGNRADAEDAVSDAFETLLTKSNFYVPRAKFSTWFYTVLRNKCVSRIRRRKFSLADWFRSDDEPDPVEQIPDRGTPADQKLYEKESAELIQKAIERLPLPQREAIVLREYQDLGYEEISRILGCSLVNVKILIFRARGNLRKWLSPILKEER